MRQALFSFVVAALCVQQAVSHPFDKRASDSVDIDTQVLNYALTLEHLENAFYSGALAQFDETAFQEAGLPSLVRERFTQVAVHEATHVAVLSTVLGDQATQPCTYYFPYDDVKSFAALSQVLEGVGASAYTGAAQFLTSPVFLTAAASILSTEARHASWVASAVDNAAPWYAPFEIPLPPAVVLALASQYIKSCPSTNPTLLSLLLEPLPALTLHEAVPGQNATVHHDSKSVHPKFIVFYSGLSETFVSISKGQVVVPANISGQVYAVATSSGTEVTDATIVAGPVILSFV